MPAFNRDNYVAVQERINRFWREFPNGAIRTYLVSDNENFQQCRYNAAIFKECSQTNPDATGWAFEVAGTSPKDGANYGSHEENCETSAIGRALANFGYATSQETRPSREEMTKVAKAEPKSLYPPREVAQPARTAAEEMQSLHGTANKVGISHQDLHDIAVGRGKGSLSELTAPELKAFNEWLKSASIPAIQKAVEAGRKQAVPAK